MRSFELTQIGIVHSPIKSNSEAPIQPKYSDIEGEVEVFPEFETGLRDLDGFSHITVVFIFDRAEGFELLTKPYLGDQKKGVFATRSPYRPNHLGISTLRNLGVEGNKIRVLGLDILDGTPVVDIKPFVPGFSEKDTKVKGGWLENRQNETDGRKSIQDKESER